MRWFCIRKDILLCPTGMSAIKILIMMDSVVSCRVVSLPLAHISMFLTPAINADLANFLIQGVVRKLFHAMIRHAYIQ